MKKILISLLIIFSITTSVIFAGCQSKNSTSKNSNSSSTSKAASSKTKFSSTKENFKPLKPKTVKQLSPAKKAQVKSKLGSAIDSVNSSIKSLDDVNDVDTSSAN